MLALLAACDIGETGADTGDSADTGADTADTADTADSADTGGDSGLPADDGWPAHFAAPYVDATAYPTVKVGDVAAETAVDHFTLAFVVAASATACNATWGTYYDVDTGPSAWDAGSEYFLYDQVATLRAAGGDVMVSFGGAANTPLEAACGSVEDVVAEYRRVIETLDLTRIDFDIEGSWVSDVDSVRRRSEAIVALQAWAASAGRPLHVWYTLPVLPTGLTADGLAVVQDAVEAGVILDGVNVMTMDYGDGVAPDPEGHMGDYGIAALAALNAQLAYAFPGAESDRWAHLGSTPMIGQNDVQSERFYVADAEQTREFAELHGVGMLGFWSINRDHPCAEETEWASGSCNGFTDVGDWAYAEAFAGYGE
ncbi:hypothetical protein LBMAG42_38890 [Deltaproteobacteria bacterium]|nr:hypothetical protein LBMAG42_38890 [Deltaproteobacteria bacterium]